MGSMTSSPFPTERHLYYALARALNRGYTPPPDASLISVTSRPALPLELVLDIFDLAGFLQTNPTDAITVYSRGECNIVSFGGRNEKLFFHSGPLSRMFLTRVRQMRLNTVSRDQGWVSDLAGGSWSWFEVGILQPVGGTKAPDSLETVELDFTNSEVHRDENGGDDEGDDGEGVVWDGEIDDSTGSEEGPIERDERTSGGGLGLEQLDLPSNTTGDPVAPPDGTNESARAPAKSRYRPKQYPGWVKKTLRWKSHHNVLASFSHSSQDGEIFGPDHGLWRYLDEGDVIAVYACALYPGWQNDARSGKLEFWEKFDPMGLESGSKEKGSRDQY